MSGEAAPKRRFNAGGCALRVAIGFAVLVAIVVAIGVTFDQGDKASQPTTGFDAGPAENYQRGSVVAQDAENLFIVRLPDGTFLALYNLSDRQQELGGDCRVRFDDTAGIGTLDPIPGMSGAFVEDCNGSRAVWRPDGVFAFGNSYGDLNRYDTHIDGNGHLIVDTSSRSCSRSRGVNGLPPFEQQRCS